MKNAANGKGIPIDRGLHRQVKLEAANVELAIYELAETALRYFLALPKAERQAIYEQRKRGTK
jgi:hypothetical protein